MTATDPIADLPANVTNRITTDLELASARIVASGCSYKPNGAGPFPITVDRNRDGELTFAHVRCDVPNSRPDTTYHGTDYTTIARRESIERSDILRQIAVNVATGGAHEAVEWLRDSDGSLAFDPHVGGIVVILTDTQQEAVDLERWLRRRDTATTAPEPARFRDVVKVAVGAWRRYRSASGRGR
jgi:hypothetical protein